jgi:ASPIC and UnbV
MIIPDMGNNPDWIFYRDDKPNEAGVMPRLLAEFPGFRPRWEKHLEPWKGKPTGSYNDIAQFVHFVVQNLYPNGNCGFTAAGISQLHSGWVLLNDTQTTNHWIEFKLRGVKSNRDGIGATLKVTTSLGDQYATVTTGGSYQSSSDPRIHFGRLGEDKIVY